MIRIIEVLFKEMWKLRIVTHDNKKNYDYGPAMKIAPESEKSKETPGFEIISLIILLVIVIVFMRRSYRVV